MAYYVEDNTITKVKYYNSFEKWPSDANVIGYKSFANVFAYELVIPETIKEIRSQAFSEAKIKNITLPSSLKKMGEMCFCYNENLKNVLIKSNYLKEIPAHAFNYNTSLKKVTLPPNIEEIEAYAFSNCESLEYINIPKKLKKIGTCAFLKCYNLLNLELNDSIEKIESGAFMNSGLTKITLPSKLKTIENNLFSACERLETVNIPSSITYIGQNAFKNCQRLENIKLPENLKIIDNSAFEACEKIESIDLPKSIISIGNNAFRQCVNLLNIKLPNITTLEEGTFAGCISLKKVELPNTLKYIGADAFDNCTNLEDIQSNNLKIKEVGRFAFSHCEKLKRISLPFAENINHSSFNQCTSLKDIEFSPDLKTIGDYAFYKCSSLEKLLFSSDCISIGYLAFGECTSLKEIHFSKNIEIDDSAFPVNNKYEKIYCYNIDRIANTKCFKSFVNNSNTSIYINDKTQEFLIQSNAIKDVPKNFRKYNEIEEYVDALQCKKNIAISLKKHDIKIDELKNKHMLKQEGYINLIENNLIDKIKDIYDAKEFFNIISKDSILLKDNILANDYIKLAFNLGAFASDDKTRQRASNFIKNLLDKGIISVSNIHSMFESMQFDGYKAEWSEFIMDKNILKELFKREKYQSGYISRTYNAFEEIKEFNRSNKGNQHYRKVTIEACDRYFSKVAFDGVDEGNEDIAVTISGYTRSQVSFNEAKEIRKEYLKLKEENKISDHLLNEELKEVREDFLNDTSIILNNLNEVSNNKFSYEFLSKYDPRNFVLGKYCSCCAHLEGAGYSIMRASILHPTCQNLVLKDREGNIIAKSTLYINKDEGYGIFNNVEINNNINREDRKPIYDKYKEAINNFAKRYNEINKEKPLTQINVGMCLNDLSEEIKINDEKGSILAGIDFSKWGKDHRNYDGDWKEEQYIIWKNK